jgi:hypothetical protein
MAHESLRLIFFGNKNINFSGYVLEDSASHVMGSGYTLYLATQVMAGCHCYPSRVEIIDTIG